MTTKSLVAALAAATTLAGAAGAHAHTGAQGDRTYRTAPTKADKKAGAVDVQLLTVSDWHGQLTPVNVQGVGDVGGAPVLKAYFRQAERANPNTLTFMAGDSVGATPPISSAFADEPAIQAMNMLGVDADTLGNHNFDAGVERARRHIELASFPFVSANLSGLERELPGAAPWRMLHAGDVRVAVIGITNEEAPTLVAPGALGSMQVTDGVAAANRAAKQARKAGADATVVLTHKGIRGMTPDGRAFGELIDFTEAVDGKLVDVVVGDHTDFQYSGTHGGVLAVENRSKGLSFASITMAVDRKKGVLSKGVQFRTPLASGVTPDAELQRYVDDLNTRLRPILGRVIGDSAVQVLRTDACGNTASRLCESLVGNTVTDALRETYGTQLALTNSGGLRAALTCPAAGTGGFCPESSATPFPITRGSVLGVLPFGNVSATGTLSGEEVKAFLEHGLSSLPGANGRFPQVSGLCVAYDIAAPAGSRVTRMVLQAADGSCTGAPITSGTTYSVTTNDFTASGGDGYPNVLAKFTTRGIMDADVASWIEGKGTIRPSIQGRIACTDGNGDALPNCAPQA